MSINNKQTIKLYTEEQVKKVYLKGWMDGESDRYSNDGLIEAINDCTYIELPSDEDFSTSLCYYDLRNREGILQFKEDKENYCLDDDDFKDLGNFAKKDCACDNCFYGRHKLSNYILKIQGGEQ